MLTKQQWALWEELNFWHGMEATSIDTPHASLCGMAELEIMSPGQFVSALMCQCPKGADIDWYWWRPFDWKPRRRFIRQQIRRVECELEAA